MSKTIETTSFCNPLNNFLSLDIIEANIAPVYGVLLKAYKEKDLETALDTAHPISETSDITLGGSFKLVHNKALHSERITPRQYAQKTAELIFFNSLLKLFRKRMAPPMYGANGHNII